MHDLTTIRVMNDLAAERELAEREAVATPAFDAGFDAGKAQGADDPVHAAYMDGFRKGMATMADLADRVVETDSVYDPIWRNARRYFAAHLRDCSRAHEWYALNGGVPDWDAA